MSARDATALVSLPVIALDEGRAIGQVRDVLFDPAEQALLGLVVSTTAGMESALFLDRHRVQGLGKDAVTVERREDLRTLSPEERAHQVVESGIHLGGAKVLTRGGDSIGKIDRVLINDDGSIAAYVLRSGPLGIARRQIPAADVVKIGEDAIIVSAASAREDGRDRTGDGS